VPNFDPKKSQQRRVDFTVVEKHWMIEFVRSTNNVAEHLESLEKDGKYYRETTKKWVVVVFIADNTKYKRIVHDNLLELDFTEFFKDEKINSVKWTYKGKTKHVEMKGGEFPMF